MLFPVVQNLYKNIEFSGIIFVFRLSTFALDFISAKKKLKFLLNEPELKHCALAVVGNVGQGIDSQYKNPEFLKTALGVEDLKHIANNMKQMFVFDAKFNPKESQEVWRWISIKTDNLE